MTYHLRFLISVVTSLGTEQPSYSTASSTLSNICPALFLHTPDSLSNTRFRQSPTRVICPTVSSTHYSMSNVCVTLHVQHTHTHTHFRHMCSMHCMPSTCSQRKLSMYVLQLSSYLQYTRGDHFIGNQHR
jgi:hypothetical protein